MKKSKIGARQVIKYFWKVSMTQKKLFLLTMLGGIGASIISLSLPIFYAKIIDIISSYGNIDRLAVVPELIKIVIIIGLLELGSNISRRTFGFSIIPLEIKNVKKIYAECFSYLHKHSYRFFANSFGGALVKKINKLSYSYETITDIFMFSILRLAVFLPFIIITIFRKNRTLGLIFLIFVIVYGTFQYVMYKRNIPNEIEANKHDSKITGELSDTITNNFNILTFSSLEREFKKFFKTLSVWERIQKKTWYKGEYIRLVSDLLLVTFEVLTIYLAIKLWGDNLISTGTIVLLQAYIFKVFEQMFFLGNTFKRLNKTIGESSEMLEILDQPHEIQDEPKAKKLKISKGNIEFKDVTFSYNNEHNIFDGLNFNIKPGEKVALVGASGAGKTSIVKLLFRFFNIQNGEILIDGQNIAKVTQDSLRNLISMVPQDPVLFHRSLEENISYGKPGATKEEIIEAAKKAKCHQFISELKEGYNTKVGERGIKLSGGERQRVAIARAILADKKILVLDEATSSLDSESEKLIQDAIDKAIKGKTAIVIAHRLSTIMKMDRIIVFEDGKIIEEGTHTDLLNKKSGIYKKLWDIQSGGFIE